MIKLIIFFLFIAIATKGNAQSARFDKLYDFYIGYEVAKAILVESNNYLIGGVVLDSTTNTQKLGLLSLDLSGNILYKKSYGSDSGDFYLGYVGSMVKTYDGGYMLGGSVDYFNSYSIAMLMKLDANGDSLWTKYYGDSVNICFFLQIKQTRDSGFICVGNKDILGPNNLVDIYIVKTDKDGNLEWEKKIGSPTIYEQAVNVQQTFDGDYVVGCNKTDIAGNVDTYLIKLDSTGNIIWQHTYGSTEDDCPAFVELLPDSSYIITTCFTRTQYLPYLNTVFRFMKINSGGGTVWVKEYGDTLDYGGPFAIERTNDGNYIVSGQGNPTTTFGPNATVLGRIFKVSPQGDSLWYRSYYPNTTNCNGLCNQNYLRAIKPTPDGGYIACGFVADVFQDMWVIKMDSMGCVDTLCVLGVGVQEHKLSEGAFSVYPNPARNEVTVKITHKYDSKITIQFVEPATGRIVLSDVMEESQLKKTCSIALLKAGFYLCILRKQTDIVAISKLIKL